MPATAGESQNLASLSWGPFLRLDWFHVLIERMTERLGLNLKGTGGDAYRISGERVKIGGNYVSVRILSGSLVQK
jgi:hypothetical protein